MLERQCCSDHRSQDLRFDEQETDETRLYHDEINRKDKREQTKDRGEQRSEMVFAWLNNIEDIKVASDSRAYGVAASSQGLACCQDTNIADSTCCVRQLVMQCLVIEKLSQNFESRLKL